MSNKEKKITSGELSGEFEAKLFMRAVVGEFGRIIGTEFKQICDRLDRIENAWRRRPEVVPNPRRRERVQPRDDEEEYATLGEMLVTRQVLGVQAKKDNEVE